MHILSRSLVKEGAFTITNAGELSDIKNSVASAIKQSLYGMPYGTGAIDLSLIRCALQPEELSNR
jgi:hypothetical protein